MEKAEFLDVHFNQGLNQGHAFVLMQSRNRETGSLQHGWLNLSSPARRE